MTHSARQDGWYKVRSADFYSHIWRCAFWESESKLWYCTWTKLSATTEMAEVGERIPMPDDPQAPAPAEGAAHSVVKEHLTTGGVYRCTRCNGIAEWRTDEKVWRHAGEPHQDGYIEQGFCDRYGYPIDVNPTVKDYLLVQNAESATPRPSRSKHLGANTGIESAANNAGMEVPSADSATPAPEGREPCSNCAQLEKKLTNATVKKSLYQGMATALLDRMRKVPCTFGGHHSLADCNCDPHETGDVVAAIDLSPEPAPPEQPPMDRPRWLNDVNGLLSVCDEIDAHNPAASTALRDAIRYIRELEHQAAPRVTRRQVEELFDPPYGTGLEQFADMLRKHGLSVED